MQISFADASCFWQNAGFCVEHLQIKHMMSVIYYSNSAVSSSQFLTTGWAV